MFFSIRVYSRSGGNYWHSSMSDNAQSQSLASAHCALQISISLCSILHFLVAGTHIIAIIIIINVMIMMPSYVLLFP